MEKKIVQKVKTVVDVRKRQFEGEVISVSGVKTVSVRVDSMKTHPKYNKQYKQKICIFCRFFVRSKLDI